jgi:hypothetical protein
MVVSFSVDTMFHTSPIEGYKSVQMSEITKQRVKSCSKLYAYVVPL